MRFEYMASGGLLLGVEILSSRWLFVGVEAPTLRVSSPQHDVLRGTTSVKCTRAAVDSDSFEAEDDATLEQTGSGRPCAVTPPRSRRPAAGAEHARRRRGRLPAALLQRGGAGRSSAWRFDCPDSVSVC